MITPWFSNDCSAHFLISAYKSFI